MNDHYTLKKYIILVVILLFGFFLRVYSITEKSLWFDEAVLYEISNTPINNLIEVNGSRNSTPILFPFSIHVIIVNLGDEEIFLRGISLFAGILSLALLFRIVKILTSAKVAYLIAFFAAISPTLIMYSQEVREYSLTFLLAMLMVYSTLQIYRRFSWESVLQLIVFTSLGIVTQYGMALFTTSLTMVLLYRILTNENKLQNIKKIVLFLLTSLVVVIFVYISSLRFHFSSEGFGSYYLENYYWSGRPIELVDLTIDNTMQIMEFALPSQATLIFFFIGLVGLIIHKKKFKKFWLVLVYSSFLLPYFAAILRFYPYGGTRQVMYLLPIIYITLAFGVEYLIRTGKPILYILSILVFYTSAREAYAYLASVRNENLKPIVETVNSERNVEDFVYVYYGAIPAFNYYTRSESDYWYAGTQSRDDIERYFDELDFLLTEHSNSRMWFVFTHCHNKECNSIVNYIEEQIDISLIQEENNAQLFQSK